MNVALPALVVFLILLPGFVFRARLKRSERVTLDYSPFGQVVAEAVLWAGVLHLVWLLAAALAGWSFDLKILMLLLSSDPAGQGGAIAVVGRHQSAVVVYFASLLAVSFALPAFLRGCVTRYKLDRVDARLSRLTRFHDAPWYYLLTGADFDKDATPDLIQVSAVVNIAGEAYLYIGLLDEFFVDRDGQLDRLVLQKVSRRRLCDDKNEGSSETERFYAIDGDYFVLRYSEAITLNIHYIALEPAAEEPRAIAP